MTKQKLIKKARLENQAGVRMKRNGMGGLAEQCFWFARGFLKEARQA